MKHLVTPGREQLAAPTTSVALMVVRWLGDASISKSDGVEAAPAPPAPTTFTVSECAPSDHAEAGV